MNKEEQKLLNDSLSKLFKIDPETLASLYNDAGDLIDFSPILDADAEKVKKAKEAADNQYKRGIKEGASKIEKEVKEKYQVESELVGVDLIDQLVVTKVEEVKASGTKDITKHPEYIKLQMTIDKQLKDRDKEWEGKLTAKEAEFNKAKLFEKVSKRGLTNLESRHPILPSDPRKAQALIDSTYLAELGKAYYMGNGDDIIVLNAEGLPLTNTHGHKVTFDEFEKEIADKYFEYPVATPRSGSGNTTPTGSGTTGFVPPKSEEEYMTRLRKPDITPAERISLSNWFNNK
jgi:hypothetical protein